MDSTILKPNVVSSSSYSSIWSPASIPSDLMGGNSCMQPRAYNHHHHHHMGGGVTSNPTGSPCYPTQNYPNYYGNMDYAMSHHSQLGSSVPSLNHMTGSGNMSSHMSSVMNSHGLHSTGQTLVPRSSPLNGGLPSNDCLDYKPEPSSWTSKFQVL